MKLTKPILCAVMAGTMLFAADKASAVLGPCKISVTASYQDYNSHTGYAITKTKSVNQKTLLQLLALATGDANITNHPTIVYYNPDVFNENAFDSNEGFVFYGEFYYSNSVDGLTALDGIDGFGDYYSYIELDSYVDWDWPPVDDNLGFANPDTVEFNAIATESISSSVEKVSLTGNGLLYIHSDPYYYNLENGDMFYANEYYGEYQEYALVIRGPIQFKASIDSKETESISLTGSGDGMWWSSDTGYIPLVINGTASFKGTGPY